MTILRYWIPILTILVVVSTIPFVLSYETSTGAMNQPLEDFTVPSWIKNNAGWWADNLIDDNSFVSGIQWLISNDVILLPPTEQGVGDSENIIPRWIKTTANWWSDDQIPDVTFVSAIKYLINEGIMVVMEPATVEETKCDFKGIQVICPDVKESEEIKDFYMRVNAGNCCFNWAYVNDDYRFQIETFDEKHGNSIDGVTITAKIISKDGELRYDIGQITTEDGIYVGSVHIPNIDWYAENILSVTGEYYGVEKTIEKEFEVFAKKRGGSGCSAAANPFDVSDRDGDMTSITFSSDGTKMYILRLANDKVYEYKLCRNYHLGSISYTTSFSLAGKESTPHGIAFNSDGTKMFIVGQASQGLNEFALSTAWDLSSASWTVEGCTNGGSGKKYSAVDFNADGTGARILDKKSNTVREFVLSTAYDISTCGNYDSSTDSTDLNGLSGVSEAKAQGMAFNDDGTKMYIVGEQHDKVYELDLGAAYDVSRETFVASFDISDQETVPSGLEFSSDGKTMFVVGRNGDEINIYNLTTAWSISTAEVK